MTTAAKATWNAAMGEASDHGNWSTGGQTSRQFSVKDMPGHTKLKYRQSGQGKVEEIKARDLKEEAEAKEQAARMAKLEELGKAGDQGARDELRRIEGGLLLLKDKEEITKATLRFDDRDDEADEDEDDGAGKRGEGGGGSDSDSDLDSSDDEDDDDDEELLRLELEKIKREREEARRKQEEEEKAAAAKRKEEEINAAALKGNPLLVGAGTSAQVKRKWNDDVVFKNQSRGAETGEKKKRFINDTIRNDFHKSFLKRYMK